MIYRSLTVVFVVTAIWHAPPTLSSARAAEVSSPTYTMQDIVTLASERHPSLAEANAVLSQRRGERVQAGAYPNPTVIGQAGEGSVKDPDTGASRAEFLVTMQQPIEWFGKRSARQRAADANVTGARAGIEEARLNIVAEAKAAFFQLLLAQREAAINRERIDIVKEVARVAQIRVQSGEAARLEGLKATVELLTARQALARAEKSVRTGRVRLNTVTGGALGRMFRIKGEFRGMEPGLDLDTLSARALTLHPMIQRLESQVERADMALAKERHSRVPDITFFGGYAREIGREAVIGGLSVPTPLWSQRQGEIATALGVKRQEEAALYRARNNLVTVIAQDFQDAEAAAVLITLYEKGLLKQAHETLRIAQFSFREGAASLLEVLDAQRVFQQVRSGYVRTQLELSLALTRLERSAGGVL